MLIVCPACASAYQIEAERVGANGRSVRCAACRETWFVTPDDVAAALMAEAGDAATDAGDAPEAAVIEAGAAAPIEGGPLPDTPTIVDEPMPRTQRAARPDKPGTPKRRAARLTPALVAGLVLFVVVPLALLGRSTVVRAMPQTASLFAGLGLPVNLRGVSFRDVVAFQNPAEGGRPGQLVVEGDLVGVARARADVPPVEIVVRDGNGQPLYRWSVPAPRAALEAGETARLRASLSAPPPQGRQVELRFAEARFAEAGPADAGDADTRSAGAHAAPPAGH